MTIHNSGIPISLSQIVAEFGGAAPHSVSEYFLGGTYVPSGTAGIPSSGANLFSNYYGKSAFNPKGFTASNAISGTNFIQAVLFNTDTYSLGPAMIVMNYLCSIGLNSSTSGYWTQGMVQTSYANVLTIERTTFSPEVQSVIAASLARVASGGAGVNSVTSGYIGGGYSGSATHNNINRLIFATESYTDSIAYLAYGRWVLSGVNSNTRGYFLGGSGMGAVQAIIWQPPYINEIDGIDFATSVAINPAAALAINMMSSSGYNSATRGYLAGGRNSTTTVNATTGFTFSTETAYSMAQVLSRVLQNPNSLNSKISGYICGGSYGTTVEKMLFSVETFTDSGYVLGVNVSSGAGCQSGGIL